MDTMVEAEYLTEEWKAIYNHERPHGSLNGMTPKQDWENLDARKPISYRISTGLLSGDPNNLINAAVNVHRDDPAFG